MSSTAPRRRAQRPPSRLSRLGRGARGLRESRLPATLWTLVVVAAAAALVASVVPWGPTWLDEAGAVTVTTAYAVGLAARTGGRWLVFGALALALGLLVLRLDLDTLCTGAAVSTSVLAAVLGVMITVPAVSYAAAAREALIALAVAGVGAFATVAYRPVVDLERFEYVALGLSVVGAFLMVYRLGAGLHGLGKRGVGIVVFGSLLLALTLAYAELLRRYGTPGLVESVFAGVRWSNDHLGAFPRPIEALLGVPALVWGTHMRARRRQGWWVCAFGVAATAPVAYSLVDPGRSYAQVGLSTLYAFVVGVAIGFVLVRGDVALTGPRGRRSREAEEAQAGRPEPARSAPLL